MKTESKNTPKKPRGILRKILGVFGYAFMIVFALFLAVAILLAFPPMQTFVAKRAAAYLSDKMGVQVDIGRISLSLITRKVQISELSVLDHHSDTLLVAGHLETGLAWLDLASGDIELGETTLENALFRLHKYEGESGMNLDYIIRQFKSDKPKEKSGKGGGFRIAKIGLENVEFNLIDDTATPLPADFQPANIRTVISRGDFNDFRIAKDSIIFKIRELQAIDRSGSGMAHFNTDFVICSSALMLENTLLETVEGSFIKGDIRMRYNGWSGYSSFIDSVSFDCDIEQSSIFLKDVAFYADALKGVPVTAKFKGKVTGPISSMKGRDLEFSFGENSVVAVDADMYGLPSINSTFFDVKVRGITVTAADISKLKLYEDGSGIQLPAEIYRMGKIQYTGRLSGNMQDFVSRGTLKSDVGTVWTDIRLAAEPGFKNPEYSGIIKTQSFDPGMLLATSALGPISGEIIVEGKGFDPKTMKATADAEFSSFVLNGYAYSNIVLNGIFSGGAFNGTLDIDDANVDLSFRGTADFYKPLPFFDFAAEIRNADLNKIGLWKDTLVVHKVNLTMKMGAKNIDEISGVLYADSLLFTADTNTHYVQRIFLQADSSGSQRHFTVNSSILDMDVSGDFKFVPLLNNLMYNANLYFPSLKLKYDENSAREDQRFEFTLGLKNLKPVFDLFSLDVTVSPDTKLSGSYSSASYDAFLELVSSYIGFKKMGMTDPELSLNTSSDEVEIDLSLSRFNVSDSLWFDYINLESKASNDSVNFDLKWTGDVYDISSGNINFSTWLGNPGQYDLYFFDTDLMLKGSRWTLKDNAFVGYSNNRLLVQDFDLLSDFGGSFRVYGAGTDSKDERLDIELKDFPLAYLRTFGQNIPEMGGALSGTAGVRALFDVPLLSANLRIDTLSMYGQPLGDFIFTSEYGIADQSLLLNGTLKTQLGPSLELKNGKIYPTRKTGDNMDLSLTFNKFNIKPAEAFLAPVMSNLKGFLSGKIHVGGAFSSPSLTGEAIIEGGHVEVPYIGASYSLKFSPSKKAVMTKNKIDFGEIILEDEYFQKATLKGYISHDGFKNMELFATVSGKKFQFFNANKEQSPMFYGTAIASGTAELKGPFQMLDIHANMRTEKGTRLFVPMQSGPSQASENSFVIFVDSRDTISKAPVREKKSVGGIQLFIEAEVNDNAEVQIIFDEFTGDVIKSIGRGNMRVELNRLGDLSMYGDYEVIKGDYLFTLKNLINKKLKLNQGGTIYWSGDPARARIDASASYSLRTSPSPLFPEAEEGTVDNANFKSRIPVDVVVKLSGELLEPQISFDIQFPTVDEATRSRLQQAINNEDEKNKQAFALLVLRQFISSNTGTGEAASVAGGNTLEVLSNQLSNWVSQLSEDIDVGVRYRGKEKTSTGQDEVELALSTRLFNDRVSIDGNVGLATTKNSAANNTNMLDLTVEVKLTNDGKLRVRGFNRSNDANIIRPFPYTQGVGISYQTAFDRWRDLFVKRKKRNSPPVTNSSGTEKSTVPVSKTPTDSVPSTK